MPPTVVQLAVESAYEAIGQRGGMRRGDGVSRFRGELSHRRSSRRASIRLWGGMTADQAWGGALSRNIASAATIDSTVTLTRRNRLELSSRISASPLDLFTAFGAADPGVAERAVGSRTALHEARTVAQHARLAFSRTLDARSEMTVGVAHAGSTVGSDRVDAASINGRFARRVGPFASWHAAYGVTGTTFERGGRAALRQRHDLDFGFDYARPLPFWSHTTATVTTGSTLLVDRGRRHIRLSPAASLERRVTRWWSARVDYSRPVQFVAGFVDPLLSDAVRGTVTGILPARLSATLTAGVARGTLGRSAAARFTSYSGSARLSRRLGPVWQMEIEYHDARYAFSGGASPGASIPAAFGRRGLRAGVVWAPVLAR